MIRSITEGETLASHGGKISPFYLSTFIVIPPYYIHVLPILFCYVLPWNIIAFLASVGDRKGKKTKK